MDGVYDQKNASEIPRDCNKPFLGNRLSIFDFKNANFEPKTSLCGPNVPLDIFRDRVQMGLVRSRTRSRLENMKIVIF